jgi:predicted  nucleic acid-binding Zn-ribbon protein
MDHNINFRLLQNRKSARKCRQKKKAELTTLQQNFESLARENEGLKHQVSTRNDKAPDQPNYTNALPEIGRELTTEDLARA